MPGAPILTPSTPDEETVDGRVRNKEAVQKIRDTWIYHQVQERKAQFTHFHEASVFLCCELLL